MPTQPKIGSAAPECIHYSYSITLIVSICRDDSFDAKVKVYIEEVAKFSKIQKIPYRMKQLETKLGKNSGFLILERKLDLDNINHLKNLNSPNEILKKMPNIEKIIHQDAWNALCLRVITNSEVENLLTKNSNFQWKYSLLKKILIFKTEQLYSQLSKVSDQCPSTPDLTEITDSNKGDKEYQCWTNQYQIINNKPIEETSISHQNVTEIGKSSNIRVIGSWTAPLPPRSSAPTLFPHRSRKIVPGLRPKKAVSPL